MRRVRGLLVLGALALAAFTLPFAAACEDEEEPEATATTPVESPEATDSSQEEGTAIEIGLQEWAVLASATSAPAGSVTFTITNHSTEMEHEFKVVKTDLGAANLPTLDDGNADESQLDIAGAVAAEDLQMGDSATLTLNLEAGSYALICTLTHEAAMHMGGATEDAQVTPDETMAMDTQEDELQVHYRLGMRTDFTVE